jgi:hypothetical protein
MTFAPDLEALESAIATRLMEIDNTSFTPTEPLLRSVFNLIDESLSDDETPRKLPGVGILHESEDWEPDRLLGEAVAQEGRERWQLYVLCDAPNREGGMRGKRGAYNVTKQIIEDMDGWPILAGCPLSIDRRHRYQARNENGELVPIAGYVLEMSHPVYYETD